MIENTFLSHQKTAMMMLAILYSSGTTSEPKGVMITYEAQMKSAELLLRAFGTNDIRYLIVFPMFHVSGFQCFCFIIGRWTDWTARKYKLNKTNGWIPKYKPNAFGMVPKVYETFYTKIVSQLNNKNLQ
ncbi:MAG: AMP-binding protein [Clostridium sp.]